MSIVVLTGGIGGAKLVHGLAMSGDASRLWVFVNTGDDFEHLGLHVCPDFDSVVYALSGLADSERGWGRAGESWAFLSALKALGGPSWFRLGDKDLALNVLRTHALRSGVTLSEFCTQLCRQLGVAANVLPASEDPVRTEVLTAEGCLPFQNYFVEKQCAPRVREIRYAGAAQAHPHPLLLERLRAPDTAAVILAPSNPWLSIGPILAIPGVRAALRDCAAPVVAVTPIIRGEAVKGPTAKIMRELSVEVTALSVAGIYREFLDGFVLDRRDASLEDEVDMPVCVTDTLMRCDADRRRLATEVESFAGRIGNRVAPGDTR